MWLKDTRISRSGVTAKSWNFETSSCSFDPVPGGFILRFNIASKGGGRTDIKVAIGRGDLPVILGAIATGMTGSLSMLMEAASRAAAHTETELISVARDLGEAATGFEPLVTSANARFWAAPSNEDDDERAEMEKIAEVASLVEDARDAVLKLSKLSR
jgi:hypothetical protein